MDDGVCMVIDEMDDGLDEYDEALYSEMLEKHDVWVFELVVMLDNQYIETEQMHYDVVLVDETDLMVEELDLAILLVALVDE